MFFFASNIVTICSNPTPPHPSGRWATAAWRGWWWSGSGCSSSSSAPSSSSTPPPTSPPSRRSSTESPSWRRNFSTPTVSTISASRIFNWSRASLVPWCGLSRSTRTSMRTTSPPSTPYWPSTPSRGWPTPTSPDPSTSPCLLSQPSCQTRFAHFLNQVAITLKVITFPSKGQQPQLLHASL